MESQNRLIKRKQNVNVVDFWKDQDYNSKQFKQFEKEKNQASGFTERYQSDIVSNGNTRLKALINAESILNDSRNSIGSNHKHNSGIYQNSSLDGIENIDHSRFSSIDQRMHNPISNPTNESAEARLKFKNLYMKQLNSQLADQKSRKQFDKQMLPREKQMNMQYLMDLSTKKRISNNPILNSSGLASIASTRSVRFKN